MITEIRKQKMKTCMKRKKIKQHKIECKVLVSSTATTGIEANYLMQ